MMAVVDGDLKKIQEEEADQVQDLPDKYTSVSQLQSKVNSSVISSLKQQLEEEREARVKME